MDKPPGTFCRSPPTDDTKSLLCLFALASFDMPLMADASAIDPDTSNTSDMATFDASATSACWLAAPAADEEAGAGGMFAEEEADAAGGCVEAADDEVGEADEAEEELPGAAAEDELDAAGGVFAGAA